MKTSTRNTLSIAASLVALVAIVGCSSDAPEKKNAVTSLVTAPAVTAEKSLADANPLQTIYFGPNEYTLNEEAKAILKKNADWLNDNPPYRLEIDGYADSRGTPEQALAMSQRRAAALRDYYALLGLPRNRIATVALGQTNPACVQDSEDCFKQNRRAETHVEMKTLAER